MNKKDYCHFIYRGRAYCAGHVPRRRHIVFIAVTITVTARRVARGSEPRAAPGHVLRALRALF